MNSELFAALDQLEKEKGIPKDYMLEKIEAALVSAFKKEYGAVNVRVVLDPNKKDMKVYQQVTDPETQISLVEAKAKKKSLTIGSFLETEVKPKNFRRLSAAAAKSVIIQGIREGERKIMQEAYENKREEIITAVVSKVDPDTGNIVLETGTSYATLLRNEQIPGEVYHVNDKIKVYVMEVNPESRGPIVKLSRVHPGLVRRMFELEIPEIASGEVEIMGVAREAGSRTKISVRSNDPDIEAVGACIGSHGMRINSILEELHGEKIDIINYSDDPLSYVAAALAPAEVQAVTQVSERSFRVVVATDQLSLAIGKEGQNARLAAKLTGFKIDIKTDF